MPLRILVTEGAAADGSQAAKLIDGLRAEHLIEDKDYDSDTIEQQAKSQGMQVQIRPHSNRQNPRSYDEGLYRHRYLMENAFMRIKQWRGIATRYAKNLSSFLAAVQIRCLTLRLKIS